MNEGNIISWLSLKNETCPPNAATLAEHWKGHYEESFAGFFCPEPWVEVVHIALCAMKKVDPDFRIGQVKEKFGGLRLYYSSNQDDKRFLLNLIVQWAEMYCADISRVVREKARAQES